MTDPTPVPVEGVSTPNLAADQLVELVRRVHLTPTQRTIVRTLIAHSHRASYLSTTELAELAHVSQPSVTRLATALGFEGYPQLRNALRTAGTTRARDEARPANEWQRSIDFELAAMNRVRESLASDAEIREVATILASSKPLVVAGHRAASAVSHYVGYFASMFLDDVRVVPSSDSVADLDVLIQAKAAGATAVLVIVVPRYAEAAFTFMAQARELGFDITCMTDSVASPAAEFSDRLLIAPIDSSTIFDSYSVPMLLSSILLSAMSEVDDSRTQERLEIFEGIAMKNGIFRG